MLNDHKIRNIFAVYIAYLRVRLECVKAKRVARLSVGLKIV